MVPFLFFLIPYNNVSMQLSLYTLGQNWFTLLRTMAPSEWWECCSSVSCKSSFCSFPKHRHKQLTWTDPPPLAGGSYFSSKLEGIDILAKSNGP